jgi:phospholipase/carboxylesterase
LFQAASGTDVDTFLLVVLQSRSARLVLSKTAELKHYLQTLKTSIRQHEARHPLMMNRLQCRTFDWPKTESAVGDCTSGNLRAAHEEYPYTQFVPLHYEQNYGYPLLVWLHGGGDSEKQLRRIMPLVSMRNYVAVAPRGTQEVPNRAGNGRGFQWLQTPAHVSQADEAVRAAIAQTQRRFHIRHDRIFLAGYESGGTMAFRIAAEHPEQYAGVLSLCGPFPTQGAPLAKLNTVRQLSLFVAACRNGKFYPTTQVCDNLRLFHSAGMSITLREYPGEDGLSQRMLADVDRWIMEQIVGPTTMADAIPPRQSGVN